MFIPTHRYRIRGLSEEDTEWLIGEVYGVLPAEWVVFAGRRGQAPSEALWRLADDAVPCVISRPMDRWDRAELVFKAYRHLQNIGVIELVREGTPHYIRNPLPPDPLAKPSRAPCVRAAAMLVDNAVPVDDTHVSVPQQMMRGLLSGALVR